MPQTALFLLAVLVAVPLCAQSSNEPWKMTVEERIARRTNPELARERVRGGRTVDPSNPVSTNTESQPLKDAFDGKSHPELFLPFEVFRQVIKLAFTGDPRHGQLIRDGLMPEVERLGLPRDFWERFRSVSAIHTADLWALDDLGAGVREQSGPARRRAEQAQTLKHDDVCRSRADALAAARKEFGRERFDRFLYEVIAVNMFHAADRVPDPALLRKIEGGCR
ncbi:MAG TPA: hypothetical protein VEK57_06400 [Thermoanaerobaculia bacterium]|nr:hypothetical protein [Thermoanaerobaculia bacterium]